MTLYQRYGANFGPGPAEDATSAEERRVLARVQSTPTLGGFADLDAHLIGATQCVVAGLDNIRAAGPPNPLEDRPKLLRDKQMWAKAMEHFEAFQRAYQQIAPLVWRNVNERFAARKANHLVELNGWLRATPNVAIQKLPGWQPPPSGPPPRNVIDGTYLQAGQAYGALVFDGQTKVFATLPQVDHLILLHCFYHFWQYLERAIDLQTPVPNASFFDLWNQWLPNTGLVFQGRWVDQKSKFGKTLFHLREVLRFVCVLLQ